MGSAEPLEGTVYSGTRDHATAGGHKRVGWLLWCVALLLPVLAIRVESSAGADRVVLVDADPVVAAQR